MADPLVTGRTFTALTYTSMAGSVVAGGIATSIIATLIMADGATALRMGTQEDSPGMAAKVAMAASPDMVVASPDMVVAAGMAAAATVES